MRLPPALLALAAALISSTSAFAGEVDDIAIEADRLNQAACLAVAEQQAVNKAGVAMAEVSVLWVKVDEVFEAAAEPKPTFLLYWRGVLAQCLDRNELALSDLEGFVEAEAGKPGSADLVKDATRRIVRLERAVAGIVDRPQPPIVVVGLTGGYQRIEAPAVAGWNYGVAALDVSVRIKGAFAVMAFLRAGVSDLNTASDGALLLDSDGNQSRSVLSLFGVGPLLRFAGPVYGYVGLLLQLAPDAWGLLGSPFLVGAAITGGIEIPLGASPLGLRFGGEVGNLHSSITVRGTGGVFLRFGE